MAAKPQVDLKQRNQEILLNLIYQVRSIKEIRDYKVFNFINLKEIII